MGTEPGADWLALLLQTNDSAFPTGGYAHSMGLEELVRMGVVRDEDTLLAHCRSQVLPALARFEFPLLFAVHMAPGDLKTVISLDHRVDSLKAATELRSASASAGKRRLEMVRRLFPDPTLEAFAGAVDAGRTPCHHLTVYGLVCAGMPRRAAAVAYGHQALTGTCLAAMKLMRMGQDGAQRVLTAAMGGLVPAAETAESITPDQAGWFDPLTDIASMRHETAFERLFIS